MYAHDLDPYVWHARIGALQPGSDGRVTSGRTKRRGIAAFSMQTAGSQKVLYTAASRFSVKFCMLVGGDYRNTSFEEGMAC